MKIAEVKKGLLDQMAVAFPKKKFKYYSQAVVENYERPCFFTQLKPIDMSPENHNTVKNTFAFYITYMPKSVDEVEQYEVVEKIREIFGLYIKVGDRAVDVTEFEYDFTGTNRNVLQITVTLEWMDHINRKVTEPVIESVELLNRMED